jgi:hypothetical protein
VAQQYAAIGSAKTAGQAAATYETLKVSLRFPGSFTKLRQTLQAGLLKVAVLPGPAVGIPLLNLH